MAERGPTAPHAQTIYPERIVNLSCVRWVWPVYLCLWPHSCGGHKRGRGQPTVGRDSGILFYSLIPWKIPQWKCFNEALQNSYEACQAVRMGPAPRKHTKNRVSKTTFPRWRTRWSKWENLYCGVKNKVNVLTPGEYDQPNMWLLSSIYFETMSHMHTIHIFFAGTDGEGILGSLPVCFYIFMTAHWPSVCDPGLNCKKKMLNFREHVQECYFTCCVRKKNNK